MTLIDNAVYVNGRRTENPATLDQTFEVMRERGGMGWIGLSRASGEEIRAVADEFNFHPLAVEDALKGHQRSKLERYADMFFVVLRPARYIDETGEVEFGELHLFVGPDFVVTTATQRLRTWSRSAAASRRPRNCWHADPRRSCTPSWTRS